MGSRAAFLGPYRSYHNPIVVEQGACTGSEAYGDNACGSIQTNLQLKPGESKEILFMLGIGDARATGKETVEKFGSLRKAETELEKLKNNWPEKNLDLFRNSIRKDTTSMTPMILTIF